MELGATVCLTDSPQCLICPLRTLCGASRKGLQDLFPEAAKTKENVEVPMAAFLIERGGKALVRKRPETERWLKGMWEFPSAEGKTFEEARARLEKSLGAKAGRDGILEVGHQITHHKVRLRLYNAVPRKTLKANAGSRWVSRAELRKLPFSSAQNKLRGWVLKTTPELRPK